MGSLGYWEKTREPGGCLAPAWLPGVGQGGLRSLRQAAGAEGALGRHTCSKHVIHQVDDLLIWDLCGTVGFGFFLHALINEGVGDISDVVLRRRNK